MWEAIPMLIAVGYCVYTDVREKKIKNYITFPMMIAGIVYNSIVGGFEGIKFSILGLFVIGVLTTAMAMMNGFGMGDVKLFMGIGAFTGWRFAVVILIYSIFSSVLISFVLSPRKFIQGIKNIGRIFKQLMFGMVPDFKAKKSAKTIAFAVHIFIGVLCAYLIGGAWIWNLL
jgi:prepilin peptidase CpaA